MTLMHQGIDFFLDESRQVRDQTLKIVIVKVLCHSNLPIKFVIRFGLQLATFSSHQNTFSSKQDACSSCRYDDTFTLISH